MEREDAPFSDDFYHMFAGLLGWGDDVMRTRTGRVQRLGHDGWSKGRIWQMRAGFAGHGKRWNNQ
jgi:hypothetical protein